LRRILGVRKSDCALGRGAKPVRGPDRIIIGVPLYNVAGVCPLRKRLSARPAIGDGSPFTMAVTAFLLLKW
jgi:hypothetical protein